MMRESRAKAELNFDLQQGINKKNIFYREAWKLLKPIILPIILAYLRSLGIIPPEEKKS